MDPEAPLAAAGGGEGASQPRRGPDDGLGAQLPLAVGEEVARTEEVQTAASAVEIEGDGNAVRGEQRRPTLPSHVLAQRGPDRRTIALRGEQRQQEPAPPALR